MTSRAQVLQRCHALPATELSHPFGVDTAVFKVGAKMFALVDLASEHGRVTVKADPEDAASLVKRHHQTTPGYYMNKRHWITVDLDDALAPSLPADLLDELVDDSYSLVVASLGARLRPTAPVPAAPAPPPPAS